MYIVSKGIPEGEHREYATAYSFVGDPAEIAEFKQCAAAILLGAAACGEADDQQAYDLFVELATEGGILVRDKTLFEAIIDPEKNRPFKGQRLNDVFDAVKTGQVPLASALAEVKSLESEITHPDVTGRIDERGLCGGVVNGVFSPDTHSMEATGAYDDFAFYFGDDSPEADVVRNCGLPINAFVDQIAYVASEYGKGTVKSKDEHTTFGVLDDEGNFEPLLSVVGRFHPVRRNVDADEEQPGTL